MKIYGPVPSWRLGNSLGIDIVDFLQNGKYCSFDCIYCQLGKKGVKSAAPKKLFPDETFFERLKNRIEESDPDYITFSGTGEPTLNLELGNIVRRIKSITDIPVAVLTNASIINNVAVRKNLDACDLVIAKIDASNQELFEVINLPFEGLRLSDTIQGIALLRTEVAIQTLLFSSGNVSNCDEESVKGLINIYRDIGSKKKIRVFLGTANRPTLGTSITPLASEGLKLTAERISRETGIEVISYAEREPRLVGRKLSSADIEREIIELLKRHSCTLEELSSRFADAAMIISSLIDKKRVKKLVKDRKQFYILQR